MSPSRPVPVRSRRGASPAEARRVGHPRATLLVIGVAIGVAAIDQGSKALARALLSETSRIPLLGDALGLQLAFNPGAALSFGAGSTWAFTILGLIAMVAFAVFSVRMTTPMAATGLGVLWGGAAGNLWDRLFSPPGFGVGHVTDLLAYGDLFIGNLADIAIGVGLGLLALEAVRRERAAHRQARA